MTFEEAMRWMRAHGRALEARLAEGEAAARPVADRFLEFLMDPHSVRAQQCLAEAVWRYQAAHPEMAVPPEGSQRTPLSQQVLEALTLEEDQRALAAMLQGVAPGDVPTVMERMRQRAQAAGLTAAEGAALMAAVEQTWPRLRAPTPDPRKLFAVTPVPKPAPQWRGPGQRALDDILHAEDRRALAELAQAGAADEEE